MDRRQIFLKAREYVRTPFHPQGRLKGRGMDCVGIVLCVGEDLGLHYVGGRAIRGSDYLNYSLFPTRGEMHNEVEKVFAKKASGPKNSHGRAAIHFSEILPGDILSIGEPRQPDYVHHLAIVSQLAGGLGAIHAYGSIERVTEHLLDRKWLARIVGVYSYADFAS